MNFFRVLFAHVVICLCIFIGSTAYCDTSVGSNISGTTWTNFQDDFGFTGSYRVNSIAPSPDNWDKVYVGSSFGESALLLADYSTHLLTEVLPHIDSVTIDPKDSKHIFTYSSNDWLVQESIDGGLTWNTLSQISDFAVNMHFIQHASGDSNDLYLYNQGPGDPRFGPTNDNGFLLSNDGGKNWVPGKGFESGMVVGPLTISMSDPNRLYALTSQGIVRSYDGGENWELLLFGDHSLGTIKADPFNANTVFVSDNMQNHVVYKSIDGGNNWNIISLEYNSAVYAIEVSAFVPNLMYLAIEDNPLSTRILRSLDSGETWSLLNNLVNSGLGENPGSITNLISGPLQSDGSVILYASSNNGEGIYRYIDYPFSVPALISGPNLTGRWTSLTQSCKNNRKGIKCKVTGKIIIQNIGDQVARPSKVRTYISDDSTYDGGDTLLKQIATGKMKPGKSTKKTFSYSFPYTVSISGKYIIALIDAENTVIETDERDNILVFGPLP